MELHPYNTKNRKQITWARGEYIIAVDSKFCFKSVSDADYILQQA